MNLTERFAAELLTRAVLDGQAAELINCLFEGGTCTLDATTGDVVLVTSDQLATMIGDLK